MQLGQGLLVPLVPLTVVPSIDVTLAGLKSRRALGTVGPKLQVYSPASARARISPCSSGVRVTK